MKEKPKFIKNGWISFVFFIERWFIKMRNKSQNRRYPLFFTIPALLFYTIFTIVPFIISFVMSFTNWDVSHMYSPNFSGLSNYSRMFVDSVFRRAFVNTLLFAGGTTILKLLFGLLLALALVKTTKINSVFRTVFYIPCVLSTLVMGVLFTSILAKSGLLNNIFEVIGLSAFAKDWLGTYSTAMGAVIMIEGWMWSGFNAFIFIAGIQAIPADYYESASVEGASNWVKFRKITLPLLIPSFTVLTTLNITGGLKVFDIIQVLTKGGPGFDTQVLSTYVYKAFGMGFLGQSCAASVIISVVVIIISFLLNRFLTKREVEL